MRCGKCGGTRTAAAVRAAGAGLPVPTTYTTRRIYHYDAADCLVRVTVEDAAGPRVTVYRDEAGDGSGAVGDGQ